PLGTYSWQVVCPDEGSAAAVRAVAHNDVFCRKTHARVGLGQQFVIPLGNFSQIDSRQRLWSELDLLLDFGQVVRWDHRSQDCWELNDGTFELFELLRIQWHVTGPKIHRSCLQLLNPASAANGLVIDLNVRVLLMVVTEPLRVDRIRESSACTIQVGFSMDRLYQPGAADQEG